MKKQRISHDEAAFASQLSQVNWSRQRSSQELKRFVERKLRKINAC